MASKTISLTNEVYQLLSKLKLPNESFGDVIKRLCNDKLSSELSIWIKDKVLWSDMHKDEFEGFKKALDDMKYTMDEVQLS
ncbi:MAG: antitoxin VapB family protein [Candidatus Kariarchaeaceae archaeon]|jgi:predicted CopG family antitoxin